MPNLVHCLQSMREACKNEAPSRVFSCEFCEIFKNNFLYKTPLGAASVPYW